MPEFIFGGEGFPDDIPEDMPEPFKSIINAAKSEQDKHRMMGDVNSHAFYGFIDGLDKDQIEICVRWMAHLSQVPGAADYYAGYLSGMLTSKFNICVAHGVNHDDDLNRVMGGDS